WNHATVTTCHSKTADLASEVKSSGALFFIIIFLSKKLEGKKIVLANQNPHTHCSHFRILKYQNYEIR
ncbi:hypothetical protein RF033_17180, partial [Serratia marcescens]|uniref:hypothetical protein n=1 Tax=Serratia marcescens TaxID=615 RepID=UPI002813D6CE